jgi:hypothetical protein
VGIYPLPSQATTAHRHTFNLLVLAATVGMYAAAAAACSPSSTSDHNCIHLAIDTDISLHYNYMAEHIVGQRCEEHETYIERNDNALFLP